LTIRPVYVIANINIDTSLKCYQLIHRT